MSNAIFDLLPTFYRDIFVDGNGRSLLLPLLQQYANYSGDMFYRMQQTASVRSLESCPVVIEEVIKTIDVSVPIGTNTFVINPSIVAFSQLYYDYTLTNPVSIAYTINVNEVDNKASITFASPIDTRYNTLYAQYAYRNPNLLRDLYGKLFGYQTIVYDYSSLANFVSGVELYRQKLLAIQFGVKHSSNISNIAKAISLWLGYIYAPCDGFVNSISSDHIGIQDPKTGSTYTLTAIGQINVVSYYIGKAVSKYDILQYANFEVYDIFSNPARFTQMLLCNSGAILLDLLNIDLSKGEKYASLFFDKGLNFDTPNLYFDMGDNTGVSHIPTDATVYPETWLDIFITNFSGYTDIRWNNQILYELFKNLFIIEFDLSLQPQIEDLRLSLPILLDRIKPQRTKYLIPTPSTTPNAPFFGLVRIWDISTQTPTVVFDVFDETGEFYLNDVQLPFEIFPHNLSYKYDFTTNMLDGSAETMLANYFGLNNVPMRYSTTLKSDWADWAPYGKSYVNVSAVFNS